MDHSRETTATASLELPTSPAPATPHWYKDAVIYQAARPGVLRQRRRRHRRFSRADAQARLHPVARRVVRLAPAVLPVAAARRRLRHRALRRRPQVLRDAEATSARFSTRRTRAGCASSPSWSSTTRRTSIHGSRRPARRQAGSRKRDYYVWSDTDQKYAGRAGSSSATPSARTGRGIRSPVRTTGTASFTISRT